MRSGSIVGGLHSVRFQKPQQATPVVLKANPVEQSLIIGVPQNPIS